MFVIQIKTFHELHSETKRIQLIWRSITATGRKLKNLLLLFLRANCLQYCNYKFSILTTFLYEFKNVDFVELRLNVLTYFRISGSNVLKAVLDQYIWNLGFLCPCHVTLAHRDGEDFLNFEKALHFLAINSSQIF